MSTYEGEFDYWGDIVDEFDLPPDTPEPDDVYAAYDSPTYEGYAIVIVRKPGDLFDVVEGYHCSCFGLEGQYAPTEDMPRAAVRALLEARDGTTSRALQWLEGEGDGTGAVGG